MNQIKQRLSPLINLLAKKMLAKKEFNKFKSVDDHPFYVELPDQCHTYYFNNSISNIMGVEGDLHTIFTSNICA